jgi:hypothetical protein
MANVIGKLQLEVFVLSLLEPMVAAPVLNGYTVRLRNEREIEVEVAKGQGAQRRVRAAVGQRLARLEHANENESTRGAVHSARRQAGAKVGMNEIAIKRTSATRRESLARQSRRFLDDRAQRDAARRAHLDPDDRAAGDHDDAVFIIFGSLVGSRIGSMDGVPYMTFIAPGLIMMASSRTRLRTSSRRSSRAS